MSAINELLAHEPMSATSSSAPIVDPAIQHYAHPPGPGQHQQLPPLVGPGSAASSPYASTDVSGPNMATSPQQQAHPYHQQQQQHQLPPHQQHSQPPPPPPHHQHHHQHHPPPYAHQHQHQPLPPPPRPRQLSQDHFSPPQQPPQSSASMPQEMKQEQPPQQDVDELLRRKRKAREHKACYPCRQRKVKCDLSRPCKTCLDREHPELCSYHPPNKRQNVQKDTDSTTANGNTAPKVESPVASTSSQSLLTMGRSDFDMLCSRLTGLENSITELRREMRRNAPTSNPSNPSNLELRRPSDASYHLSPGLSFHQSPTATGAEPNLHQPRRPTHIDINGFHTKNDTGQSVHVGASSIPAMLYALESGDSEGSALQDTLGKFALPLFGLDNHSSIYPFVDLWGVPAGSLERFRGIATALPTDEQVRKYVRGYVVMGYIVFPGIVDPAQFDREVEDFLQKRAALANSDDGVTEREIYGRSWTWLAMLFAVLASGAQGSVVRRKERELISQVFICSSFECLRVTNFLSLADLESVQALVVIGIVLTNNLNAGTAWNFHGLIIRIAQSLGLHQACPPIIPSDKVFPRSKIWWSIVWLDSLLSIGYDRPSTAYLESANMPMPQHFGDVGAFHSAMYRMSRIALDIVRGRSLPMSTEEKFDWTNARRDDVERMMDDVSEYLRDLSKCTNQREEIEHHALRLHTSYNLAEAYRHAISPNANPDLARHFRQPCIDRLADTVKAFIGLNDITDLAKNSWAALQRGLSSALLLGLLNEHTRNDRILGLLTRFTAVLQNITSKVDVTEVSAPVRRGIETLRRMRLAEAGVTEDGGPGVKLEKPMVITPASSDGNGFIADETSPNSLLTSILWGHDITNGFMGLT